jgi:energy-coupling factor transport system substrate-specific component
VSWQLASALVLALVLGAGLAWFERTRPSAKVVSLVATLAALAVVGRIAFAPFPNVKPTTDIVLFSGLAIGAAPGFAVGAITALASNVFFGQGPWTPWQMVAWGLVGVAGGLIGRLLKGREPARLPLAIVCAAAGFGYGALLDFYQWTLSATHNWASYAAVAGTSFPYNLAHALGNFVFALAIGPAFVRALRRYRRRFEVRWAQPALIAALLAALLVPAALTAAAPSAQAAASAKSKALKYVERAQNTDGGFGGAPSQSSSPLYTGWVVLGIAAAGENPRDVRQGKASPVTYTRKHLPKPTDVGELERTILMLHAAGVSPRDFGRRDLVAQLQALRKPSGSWDNLVDHTSFGILAMRAGGVSSKALRGSALWMERQQNADGGFGFGPKGGSSDADDTGSAIQALVAVGRGRKTAARKALAYLRKAQNPDGGFGQLRSDDSNAQSTAWAVQGIVAAGANPTSLRRNGHNPISYLVSLQQANGAVRYSRTSAQSPVWVTGQALTALARKPFPVAAPKRKGPVQVAKTTATTKPKPKTAPAKVKPLTAKKKPKSHGQTISPTPTATTASDPTMAAPTTAIAPAAQRTPPSTAHERKGNGHHDLALGLAVFAVAALLAGTYLTRKRLRGRSSPA